MRHTADKMPMQQSALTMLVPLLPGHTQRAIQTLNAINSQLDQRLPLQNSTSTHFARFVVVEGKNRHPDRLLFTSNYDGDEDAYTMELVKTCGVGLDEIFSHCEGYHPGDALNLFKFSVFFRTFKKSSQLFFVSLPGLTARGIRRAGELRETLDRSADATGTRIRQVLGLYDTVPGKHRGQSFFLNKHPAWMEGILNRVAGVDLHARNPNTIVEGRGDLTQFEDLHTQNALTVAVQLKKSFWRRLILRVYLFAGRVLYYFLPPWGSLNGITSIHFARWCIVDGGNTMIFESNYDGSFDSYIDTFVDVTSAGLNVIWNTAVGYPRGGCQDVASFKEIIRNNQFPARIFYSAYPDLTVKDIIANHTIDLAMQAFLRTPDIDRVLEGSYEIND